MAPRPGRRALAIFRRLLHVYPSDFRDEYERELCLVFADRWRDEQSLLGRLRLWIETVWGILVHAPAEHLRILVQDLRYAGRLMRRDAAVTAATIAILALGTGSTTLIFSLANGLLIRPLPYGDPSRLVAVGEYSLLDPNEHDEMSYLNYLDLRSRIQTLETMGVYTRDDVTLVGADRASNAHAGKVTPDVFTALSAQPALGRLFTPADDTPTSARVVVIGDGLWRDRYGRDPSVIGRTLRTVNFEYTIVGVMPPEFSFPDRADLWLPLRMDPEKSPRTDFGLRAVARLKPGVSAEQATTELNGLLEQIHRENPAANNGWRIRAESYRDVVAGSYRRAVLTLLAAVGLLLLIACANVSNILLAKASARGREVVVRRALGASRRRLVRQLVSESLVLGLAGGVAGVLIATAGVPALLSLIPIDLPRWMDFSIDGRVLGFALAVSSLTSLVFGLVPTIGLARRDMTMGLNETGRGGTASGRQKWMRNGLVVGEVALSITLLAGAGVMARSFTALRGQDLGYKPENVLTFDISYPAKSYPDGAKARALVQDLREEIGALPGVTSLVFATGLPLANRWSRFFTVEGRPLPLKDMSFVNHIVTTPGYFRTLGISLLQGRDFTDDDFQAAHIVIVTQAFASQHWPRDTALGKRIRFGPSSADGPWHEVVGVVAENRQQDLKRAGDPTVYLPYGAYEGTTPSVVAVRASGDPVVLTAAIRDHIAARDRDIAMGSVATLEDIILRAAWQDRFFTVLMGVFATMALLLAAVGLYAVLSYAVSLHTREIGIRMALGASIGRVRIDVIRQGMTLAGTGLAIGMVAAVGFTRLLRAELFQVSPTDPVTYVVAPLILLAVALAAALLPTRQATRVDPVVALRSE